MNSILYFKVLWVLKSQMRMLLCFTFLCAMTMDLIERISRLVQELDLLYGDSQLSFFFFWL
jgi:hypothetical protein